jgi:folate-binding protein YgfZ
MQELQLRPYHDFNGAIFRDEAGWSVPAGYRSVDAEIRAARTRAGMIDLSDRAKIVLTGSERVPFLDGLVTPDLKILPPGSSVYALLLNEKSRVLGDLRVYVLPDSLVLDIEAAQKDRILQILEKARVSDDVEFRNLGTAGHIEVLGPGASAALGAIFGVEVRGLARDAFMEVRSKRHASVQVGRSSSVGIVGFTIWSPDASLSEEWEQLSRAGISPLGRDAFEILRIEGGVPRFGADMGEETLALEVAPESALSFTKGCYVGQEIVARGTYVGQVRRKLLGLRVDGDLAPSRGDRVSVGPREIGSVTSSAWSPTVGGVIALGILRVDAIGQGDGLFIDRAGWGLRARLSSLPFA